MSQKSNNSNRDHTEKRLDIIKVDLFYSPSGTVLLQQYQILQDKKNNSDSRQKGHFFSLSYLQRRVTLANQNTHKDTHRGSQRDNWGIVGSRHVTGCVYKCVSQTLFLDEHTNSRPSLPRHRHAAHSCSWQSHRSHLHLLFCSLCTDAVNISHQRNGDFIYPLSLS